MRRHLGRHRLDAGACGRVRGGAPGHDRRDDCVSVIVVTTKAPGRFACARQIARRRQFRSLAKAHRSTRRPRPEGGALGCFPTSELSAPAQHGRGGACHRPRLEPLSVQHRLLLLLVTSAPAADATPTQVNAFAAARSTPSSASSSAAPRRVGVSRRRSRRTGRGTPRRTSAMVKPNPGPPAHLVAESRRQPGSDLGQRRSRSARARSAGAR